MKVILEEDWSRFLRGGGEKSEPECMVSKEKENDEVLENENEESDHDESVPENAEENLEEQPIQQTEEAALIAISDTSFNSLHHSCKNVILNQIRRQNFSNIWRKYTNMKSEMLAM